MTPTLEVEDANVPQLAKIPDEANSVLSSYFVGGQSILSRENEVQVLSNIVVECTCTQKDRPGKPPPPGRALPSAHGDEHNASRSNRITLRGMGGIGKSTIVAMVVLRQEIRSSFGHIGWINLGKQFNMKKFLPKLQFSMYFDCLQKLCAQIGLDTCAFRSESSYLSYNPGDSPLHKSSKEVQAMEKSKLQMSKLLHGRRVLIILDDVWDNGDADWFDFNSYKDSTTDLVLLTTTRTDDDFRFPGSVNININLLSEEEAINLFFMEAGAEPSPYLSPSDIALAQNIVHKCGFLPIAVKTAGRIVRFGLPDGAPMNLKDISEHVLMVSTPERTEYLESYGMHDQDHHSIQLFHILDRSFVMILSEKLHDIAALFFAAFVIVFNDDAVFRPWIPYTAIKILLERLIAVKSFSITGRRVSMLTAHELLEGLRKIGVVHVDMSANRGKIEDRKYRVSHALMWQYGRQCASFVNQKRRRAPQGKSFPWLPSVPLLRFNLTQEEDRQDLVKIEWNGLLADQYKIVIERETNPEDRDMIRTALYTLPSHMMDALQLDAVFSYLVSNKFILHRVSLLGVEEGIKRHIADIEKLHELQPRHQAFRSIQLKEDEDFTSVQFSAPYCFNFIADLLWEISCEKFCEGIYQALMKIGSALQKYYSFPDAISCFFKALEICNLAGYPKNHIDVLQIRKNIECSSLRKIVLVPLTSSTRVILKHSTIRHNEEMSLELSSHPGFSISAMFADYAKNIVSNNSLYIEIGLGPKENAIRAMYDGTFITRVEDGAYLTVAFDIYQEGNGINLKPKEHVKQKQCAGRKFLINSEGSISPAEAPHLALGVTPYPNIRLVKRNSPNKAIFSTTSSLPGELELELISHPNCSLVKMIHGWIEHWFFKLLPLRATPIGLGTNKNKLQLILLENGQIISRTDEAGLRVIEDGLYEGAVLILVQHAWYITKKSRGQLFSINGDGSISPTEAPHLALGFYVLKQQFR
eukprot:CAMPEP_0194290182 /NCGR_PEP_ID=MMETSP0169-20130528/40700_1 /TAXON_ID=218684 /ORGANISM="Corethron pennatum, Strain L29A3" /LENGTH=979 /DNA_ID=CAMNT_0039037703 /DNA_START=211 /DNA_END=3150 /DNA_ORIENTATION=-